MESEKYLFYEDNEKVRRQTLCNAIIFLVIAIASISMFAIFRNADEGVIILLWCIFVVFLVWAISSFRHFKSKDLHATFKITEEELIFSTVVLGRARHYTKDLIGYEFVQKRGSVTFIKILFSEDRKIQISTRKYEDLKGVLESLINRNKRNKGNE